MSGTIRAALDGVAQTFRLKKIESPIHDATGRLNPLLALQLKSAQTMTQVRYPRKPFH